MNPAVATAILHAPQSITTLPTGTYVGLSDKTSCTFLQDWHGRISRLLLETDEGEATESVIDLFVDSVIRAQNPSQHEPLKSMNALPCTAQLVVIFYMQRHPADELIRDLFAERFANVMRGDK